MSPQMFCSHCGTEISSDDKFCSKCGKRVTSSAKKKPTWGSEKPTTPQIPTPPVPPPTTTSAQAPGSSSAASAPSVAQPVTPPQTTTQAQAKKKKSHGCLITCIILAFLVVIGVIIGLVFSYFVLKSSGETAFNNVQDILADVLVAKSLGDDMASGRTPPDYATVKALSQAAVDSLAKVKGAEQFQGYYGEITLFCEGINNAAVDAATWATRPEEPTTINTNISGQAADALFKASLNRVATEKDYGDWAIAKGDTERMRYVYAELQAQNVFMSLMDFPDEQTSHQGNIISQVLAASGLRSATGICKKSGCGTNVKRILPSVVRSAHNYTVGEPTAAAEWTSSWQELTNVITIKDGYNLEGMAVVSQGTNTASLSPMEQAFNDECTSKGGTIGGSGGVKDRLPITLTAGTMNCDYVDNGRTCWDTLTRSGRRFMGGESGCPERGLLPKPYSAPIINPTGNWNGSYTVTMTKPNCDSPIELTTLDVSDGEVFNLYGENAIIDANGNATLVFSTGNPMTVNITFSSSGASGTWSTAECNGTFTATKGWF